ncbi:MAG: hypothetical protein ACLPVO_07460 [Desulfomonilaceae bacterium]
MDAFVHSWFGGAGLSILELLACQILPLIMAVSALFQRRINVGVG